MRIKLKKFKSSQKNLALSGLITAKIKKVKDFKMAFGDYPAEYNPKLHGPYGPARYYGKADVPFGQVKLGELGSLFSRRNKTPNAIAGAFSRACWRWNHKYVQSKRAGIAPFFQLTAVAMTFFYVINYGKLKHHSRVRQRKFLGLSCALNERKFVVVHNVLASTQAVSDNKFTLT
ncbi:putative ATP synthase subunit f, mitochondrial [Musca autumnalis]|uniref:putative ATP synthase subunit f, mitochondrial n=1 Tax=Musca autumnalis TaxID=221902 RepID=UPI003CEFFEDA